MSEVPETQRDTRAAGEKDDVWSAVRDAQSAWAGAMRSHELAPPDAGFRERLRLSHKSYAAAPLPDAKQNERF